MFPRSTGQGKRMGAKRATILIVVMWLAFAMVGVAVYFGDAIGLEYRAADNSLSGLQAEQVINGAKRYVKFCMWTYMLNSGETSTSISTDASTLNLSSSLSGSSSSDEEYVVATGVMPSAKDGQYAASQVPFGNDGYFWLVGRNARDDSTKSPTTPTFGLVDEASKLNINTATIDELEQLPNMTEALASSIVDWRDSDSDTTNGVGAESDTYEKNDPPYEAKNANFESVDELLLVHGMTVTLLYGEDVNRNGVLDPNENDGDKSWPPDNSDGVLDVGLSEYLTAWSREPNTAPDGTAKINLHGSSVETGLTTLITNHLNSSTATSVGAAVSSSKLSSIESLLEFYLDSGLTTTEFAEIEQYLTVTSSGSTTSSSTTGSSEYREGLVNVNTASATVLACLPGMTSGLAQQLVSARKSLSATDLKSVAWVGSVLDASTCAEVGPYITGRSYQYSADIVGVGHDGRGMRRRWVVYNVEKQISMIYERDYTSFGWPLGDALRQSLLNNQ
jgi:DNA uptake protein ComE-like DNA-binding protein